MKREQYESRAESLVQRWLNKELSRRRFLTTAARAAAAGVMTAGAASFLAACAKKVEEGVEVEEAVEAVETGMVIRTENYPQYPGTTPKFKPGSITYQWMTSTDFGRFSSVTYWSDYGNGVCIADRVTEVDPYSMQVMPWIVESWEINENVYQLHVRDNVLFSDGVQCTAEDIGFTLTTMKDDPDTRQYSRFDMIDQVVLDPADPLHLTVTLNKIHAPFICDACQEAYVMPYHLLSGYERISDSPHYYDAVATGAYTVEKIVEGDYMQLKARTDGTYWGGVDTNGYNNGPYIETIIAKYYSSPEMALAAFLAGELDILYPIRGDQLPAIENYSCWLYDTYSTCSDQLNFQFEDWPGQPIHNLFHPPLVRQAFQQAVNRQAIADTVYAGRFDLIDGFSTHIWARYAQPPTWPYDPQASRQKFEASGYTMGDDGMLKNADGEKINLHTITSSTYSAPEYTVMVQEDLRKVGVKIEMRVMESGALMKAYNDGTFDLYSRRNWGYGYPDYAYCSQTHYDPPDGRNYGHYSNPEMDAVWDKIVSETDVEKAKPLFQQVGKLYSDDLMCLWLGIPHDIIAIQKRILGHQPNPMMQDQCISQWYL